MLSTLSEIRSNVGFTTRESQINTRITEYINLTINEINDYHIWTFLRRKTTLSADAEDEQLPRDLDKIGLVRQTDSPIKLLYIPDERFYRYVPNPTATGNPKYYRLWEEFGVDTQLSANDTIDVVSSSADDTQTVIVTGLNANSLTVTESYTLNGTTTQAGSTTFSKILQVSKSANTAGTITVTENSGGTTVVLLGPEERSPRFKQISLYPILSSAITLYIEYYTRMRELVNDTDVPDMDKKWHYLVRQGALAKVYQYQNKENDYIAAMRIFEDGLKRMKEEDLLNADYIPHLKSRTGYRQVGVFELADDVWVPHF